MVVEPDATTISSRPSPSPAPTRSGTSGLRYVFDAAKVYVTGTTPTPVEGQHGVVHR